MSDLLFSLSDYVLNKLHFSRINKPIGEKSLTFQPSIQCGHLLNKDNIEVLLNVRIENEKLPFILDVEYKGTFHINQELETIDKKALDKIIYINCAATLFPFVRETIAETTRRAGLTPLILPSINFVSIYKENSDDI
jgi:preprotein translocase subunit SecB